jgi:hypothetical protein
MLQKIVFEFQKNIYVGDALIDIVDHPLLKDREQNINYGNLEMHSEDLLLMDDLILLIIHAHILLCLYSFYLLLLLLIFLLMHNIF